MEYLPEKESQEVSADEQLEHDTFVEETMAEAFVEDVFPPQSRQVRTARRLGPISRALRVLGRSLVRYLRRDGDAVENGRRVR
jgi:hypothetical protein